MVRITVISAWVMLNDHSYQLITGTSFVEVAAKIRQAYEDLGDRIAHWGRLTLNDMPIYDGGSAGLDDVAPLCSATYAAVALSHQIEKMALEIQQIQAKRQEMVKARDEVLVGL